MDGERAFASVDEVRDMSMQLWLAFVRAWRRAFDAVCPMYHAVDTSAWHRRLVVGAEHPTNFSATRMLGAAYDMHGIRLIERPEQFYGKPSGELTDGQLMAYRAARSIYEKQITREFAAKT